MNWLALITAVLLLPSTALAQPPRGKPQKPTYVCEVCVPVDTPSSPDDSSAGAPGGAPNAPGLFTNSGAGAAGTNYPAIGGTRPPWKVAGVDYRTGYDLTITLADPATFQFPSCAIADQARRILTVNAPCTIEGMDFSKGGGWIARVADSCAGGVVTFRNNNFVMGSNHGNAGALSLIYTGGNSTCDLTLEKNVFDGNSCVHNGNNSIGALVSSHVKVKNTTVKYNQFLNSPQHGLALNYSGEGIGNFTSRYNYWRSMGNYNTTNNHANPYLFNNLTGTYDVTVEYDTYAQSTTGGDFSAVGVCPANKAFAQGTGGISALAYLDMNNTAYGNIMRVNHNTYIAEPIQQNGTLWLSYVMRAGSASNALGPIADGQFNANYIDPGLGSTYGVYAMGRLPNPGNFKVFDNISLRNGGPCNSNSRASCGP